MTELSDFRVSIPGVMGTLEIFLGPAFKDRRRGDSVIGRTVLLTPAARPLPLVTRDNSIENIK